MGYAIVACAIVVAAALISGVIFFACGIGTYLLFEYHYGRKLIFERQKSFEAGRREEQQRRAKEIRELELPTNKYEAEEAKTYAEGLAGLYPQDQELQKAIDQSQKLKEMIGGT